MGVDPFERPEIITVLDGPVLETDERVYMYRETFVEAEYIAVPASTNEIELSNGPLLFLRDVTIIIDKFGTGDLTYWSIANGMIRNIFRGGLPDPNIPTPTDPPKIYAVDNLDPLWFTVWVQYKYMSGYEEFTDFLSIEHESVTDTGADNMALSIENSEGKYNPNNKDSDENYSMIMAKSLSHFQNWNIGSTDVEGWNRYPFTQAKKIAGTGLPDSDWCLRMASQGGPPPSVTEIGFFSDSLPITPGQPIRLEWFHKFGGPPYVGDVIVRIEEYDTFYYPYNGVEYRVLIKTTDYTFPWTLTVPWLEESIPSHEPSILAKYIKVCLIQPNYPTGAATNWRVGEFYITQFDPIFDGQRSLDFWIGIKSTNNVYEYDRRGKFYIDETTQGVDDATPSLEANAYSNIGRLSLSETDIQVYSDLDRDSTLVAPNGDLALEPFESIGEDYDNTIWRRPIDINSGYEFWPIADWRPVVVYGIPQGRIDNPQSKRDPSTQYVISGEYQGPNNVWVPGGGWPHTWLQKIEDSNFTVDYQRGWIIFKEPMYRVSVSAAIIRQGTLYADDILLNVLLQRNRHSFNRVNVSMDLTSPVTIALEVDEYAHVPIQEYENMFVRGDQRSKLTEGMKIETEGSVLPRNNFTAYISVIGGYDIPLDRTYLRIVDYQIGRYFFVDDESPASARMYVRDNSIGSNLEDPTVQEKIQATMRDGNGPGYSIDELTNISRTVDPVTGYYTEDVGSEELIASGDGWVSWVDTSNVWHRNLVEWHRGTGKNEMGLPNNNWVKPANELGAIEEVTGMLYDDPGRAVFIGAYVEVWNPLTATWQYWTDVSWSDPGPMQFTMCFIDYKGGGVGLPKGEWDSWVATVGAGTKVRAMYRYWTIQYGVGR